MDAWRREFAIQGQQSAKAAAAQIFGQRGRFQKHESEFQILEAVVGQIDQAVGVQAEGVAVHISRQRRAALFQRGGHVDVEDRPQKCGGRPFEQARHARRPADLERPVIAGDAKARQFAACEVRIDPSGPAVPRALPRDLDCQRFGQTRQRRDDAIARRIQIERHVEAIVVRHRIQFERDPIATRAVFPCQRSGIQRHLRAAIGDVGLARDRSDSSLAADRRLGDEIRDPKRADIDIVIRQQRIVARRGFGKFGRALQGHALGGQGPDIDMAAQEFERSPVDPHFGRGQEHTLRVGHGDIVEDHLAIEGSFDAPDIDLHPVLEFEPGNLVGD